MSAPGARPPSRGPLRLAATLLCLQLLCLHLCAPAAAQAESAFVVAPLPECAMHVYRHVSKAGGTTLRFIFDRQTVLGEWEYPLIYGFREDEWAGLLTRWRAAADGWLSGDRKAGPRVLVEVRGNWPSQWNAETFMSRVMPDVRALRGEYEGRGCQVTTSLLLREPLPQYLSFYNYYIKREQTAQEMPTQPKGPAYWGTTLEDWAEDNRDMQVREVLGTKCTPKMREAVFSVSWVAGGPQRRGRRSLPDQCDVTPREFLAFKRLLNEMDVVGVTDQFNQFLLLLAERIGLQHPQYIMSNTGSHEKRRHALDPAGVAAVDRSTKYDKKAFDLARERQQQLAEAAGPEFTRRLEAFEAATEAAGGRKYVGGRGPAPPYKWVARADIPPGVSPVEPPFWTEPTGGGQAVAYIYFEPVRLVARKETAGVQCRKGCNFD